MTYVRIPQEISLKEVRENHFCFAPSKYNAFYPEDRSRFEVLEQLIETKNERTVTEKDKKYTYIQIGDIDVNTGDVDYKENFGMFLPTSSPLQVKDQDILISTVRTYRRGIGFVDSDRDNITATSAFYLIRDVKKKVTKEYLFSFLRSEFFIEQILSFQNRGMYPRLDRETAKYVYIPLPRSNEELQYITSLQRALLDKQREIKRKNDEIKQMIENEIINFQKSTQFNYTLPSRKDIIKKLRIDAGYYCEEYERKKFLIKNYRNGARPVKLWGFDIKRGQNLQVSCIGKSVYSSDKKGGFYTLVRPTNFSEFGVVSKFEYLGNPSNLSVLEAGDIVFSAEGTIGKCILFTNPGEKWITNIHGIVLNKKDHNIKESAFVACFLRFLRSWGLFDYISVGGQGGSLGKQYWDDVLISDFDENKRNLIADLYHHPIASHPKFAEGDYLSNQRIWNKKAGIIQIDESIKVIQSELDEATHRIVSGKKLSFEL